MPACASRAHQGCGSLPEPSAFIIAAVNQRFQTVRTRKDKPRGPVSSKRRWGTWGREEGGPPHLGRRWAAEARRRARLPGPGLGSALGLWIPGRGPPRGSVPGGGWGLCPPAGLRHSRPVGVYVGQCRAPRASTLRPHGPSPLPLTVRGLQPDPSPGTQQGITGDLGSSPALLGRVLWAMPRPTPRQARHGQTGTPAPGLKGQRT